MHKATKDDALSEIINIPNDILSLFQSLSPVVLCIFIDHIANAKMRSINIYYYYYCLSTRITKVNHFET